MWTVRNTRPQVLGFFRWTLTPLSTQGYTFKTTGFLLIGDCSSSWFPVPQGISHREFPLGWFPSIHQLLWVQFLNQLQIVNTCSSWCLIKECLPWFHDHTFESWEGNHLRTTSFMGFHVLLIPSHLSWALIPSWRCLFEITFSQESKSRAYQTMRGCHWLKDFHCFLLCDSGNNFLELSNYLSVKLGWHYQ